ncbi:retrovirus-related Pol polyprotein from transposon 17.6 [Trichonephila clavipes]|nr:retrovirus-related Pol polyprotein from transposon 17.6 [Trichonephila clavipes]
MHKTLKRILRVLCLEAIPDWEKILPQALFALRTVIHDSTGFSPAKLVHGKNLRTPVMLLYEKLTEEEPVESSVGDYVFELINRMKRCQELVILHMEDAKQKQKLGNLFSNIPGCIDLAEHDIELEYERAIVAKPYRMSPRQIEILKSEEKVSAAKYISILDLTRGYWQIPLSPRAQKYAAFVTTFGTFKPLSLPFGLKNAPYYFSRLMANLLRNCEDFAVPYLDDIAIFSLTWDDHLKHLKDVFDRLRSAKLHIKPSKYQFAQAYVKYLGHLVGQGLRTPGELKVQVIKDFPIPTNKTQVRAFLGLSGYYRRYIPEFSLSLSNRSSTDRLDQ